MPSFSNVNIKELFILDDFNFNLFLKINTFSVEKLTTYSNSFKNISFPSTNGFAARATIKSCLNVDHILSNYSCLMCLHDLRAYVHITCLLDFLFLLRTCLHFFICLTCPHFLRAFTFTSLYYFMCFHFFMCLHFIYIYVNKTSQKLIKLPMIVIFAITKFSHLSTFVSYFRFYKTHVLCCINYF